MFERKRPFEAYYPKAMTAEEVERILCEPVWEERPDKKISYDIFNLTFEQIKELIERSKGDISVHIHLAGGDA